MDDQGTVVYTTHDNGGRPFRVVTTPIHPSTSHTLPNNTIKLRQKVEVWCNDSEETMNQSKIRGKRVFHLADAIVFGGDSPNVPGVASHGSQYNGNTVLLRNMEDNVYYLIYLGVTMFDLSMVLPQDQMALREIVTFVSPVGNNDVAYPYAIDNYHDVYLLEPSCMTRIDANHAVKYGLDIYQLPYYARVYTICLNPFGNYFSMADPEGTPMMAVLPTMRSPAQQYDFIVTESGGTIKSTALLDGIGDVHVSKEAYIRFCEQYRQTHGMHPIDNVSEVVPRYGIFER